MNISVIQKIVIFIILMVMSGCSSSKFDPGSPAFPDDNQNIPSTDISYDNSSHQLLGTFTASFDVDSLTASIKPNRELSTHYNITTLIPPPVIQINSWDPVDEVIDVDVMLHNPYFADAYDVRLIIFTDDAGHGLMNPDDWTHLYDIPEGLYSNPFKAYAKYEPKRKFGVMSHYSENILVKCPNGNLTVPFAVDASYPGNCEEPYEITNFRQDIIYDEIGSSGWIYVDVFDWQDDVSDVKIDCETIAGANDIPFDYESGNTWKLELTNNSGAPFGEYNAIIYSKSFDSGDMELIDRVRIFVDEMFDEEPLNPEIISEINPGDVDTKTVAYENGYVFAGTSYGLRVIDVHDPAQPSIVGSHPGNMWNDLDSSSKYVCTTWLKYDQGIAWYDVSDPENPHFVNSLRFDYTPTGLVFENGYVFTSEHFFNNTLGRKGKFKIIDVNFSFPIVKSEINMYYADDVAVSGNYAYVADDHEGLKIVDIRNVTNPLIIENVDTGNAGYIGAEGHYAMVVDNTYGSYQLILINVADPLNAYIVSILEISHYANSPIISGGFAYMAAGNDGIFIYDIRDPSNPLLFNDMNFHCRNIDVSHNFLYAACGSEGIKIIKLW